MQTTPGIGPTDSPTARAVADAAPSRGRGHRARSAPARLLSALRGDKYMVDAYPPAWQRRAGVAEEDRPEGGIDVPAGADRGSPE
jgi:hypothetical protein